MTFLEDVHIAGDLNLQDARFPVQWVVRPQTDEYHDFRAFAGQIASGVFKIGENVVVLPSGRRSKIKDIIFAGKSLKAAHAPMSISLLLEDEIDVSRGDMIVPSDNLPYFGNDVEAMICWMHETPMYIGSKYIIKHTTNTTKGVIKDLHFRINVDPNIVFHELGKQLVRLRLYLYQRLDRAASPSNIKPDGATNLLG